MNNTFSLLALLAIVGAGCPLAPPPSVPPRPPTTTPPVAPPSAEGDTAAVALEGKNAIALDEDQKVGDKITVSSVMLEKPGYVVVHGETNGGPGAILANSVLLPAGESVNVEVKTVVKPNIYYWAMLHADNGDGAYNSADDAPIKDGQGNIVMMRFEGAEAAEVMEKKEDETTEVKVDVEVKMEAKTVAAAIQNFSFGPATITVKKGDKVTFTNKDGVGHSATADGGAFDTGIISSNQSATVDTSSLAPGSYPFHCTPHPNMKGTIVVQ